MQLLKKVDEFSRGQPEATRFYALVSRLNGLLETHVR